MKNRRCLRSRSKGAGEIPAYCLDELAAIELFEQERWGEHPACVHCGSLEVYKIADTKTGERNKRFLWRCRDCAKQYSVRIGTIYEDSRIGIRHWCFAFWRAATSSNGVGALEIHVQCQISYKSALSLINRIRFVMTRWAVNPGPIGAAAPIQLARETRLIDKPPHQVQVTL